MQNTSDSSVSLGYTPDGKWEFDEAVTGCFEDMLERSIPQYKIMRQACFDLTAQLLQEQTYILDLGCSRGEVLFRALHCHRPGVKYLGIEISPPMIQAARERFKDMKDIVEIQELDLRYTFPTINNASVILSVLCLQFTPIEYRQQIIQNVYNSLVPGGGFVLVEKILGATAQLDSLMIEIYYGLKQQHGYTPDEIQRKRLSLEGVLVPVTAHWNEELLRGAGFSKVDCFWRWMNFAGWVAVK